MKFARAACRLYAAVLAETGEERWKRELDRHIAILDAEADLLTQASQASRW